MARRRSQQLVIDASIARAAGPPHAVHPTAKNCRDFLLSVLDICHRAVFSPLLVEEWNEHQSGVAQQWRVSMFARKKIDRLEDPEDDKLRRQIEQAAANQKQQEVMLKDVHLVEAALTGGMRVAALDETVREAFRSVAASVRRLRGICWINPDKPEEDPTGWLQAGAPAEEPRTLGHAGGEE